MPPKKTSTRKIKNIKNVIEKIKNSLKNNWGVSKTMKKKRNQVGKMILAQKEKELKNILNKKKLDFANESKVRFFSNEALENTSEPTAKEMKAKEGRYVSAKARTRKLIKTEANLNEYLARTEARAKKTREILEARWKAENAYHESQLAFARALKKLQDKK